MGENRWDSQVWQRPQGLSGYVNRTDFIQLIPILMKRPANCEQAETVSVHSRGYIWNGLCAYVPRKRCLSHPATLPIRSLAPE